MTNFKMGIVAFLTIVVFITKKRTAKRKTGISATCLRRQRSAGFPPNVCCLTVGMPALKI
ncbi:MAG TPA: hypothetical protein DCQ37_01310 [Desulfobacteraceae bacterium]|nr:hypothetical protein [Desulfobacteraceae bacterium]